MKGQSGWLTFLRIVKWVGFAQSAIFGLVAIGFAINTLIFIERSSSTTATVVDLDRHEDEDSVSFSSVFSFAASDGSVQIIHSSASSNPPGFEIGEKVPVRYVARNPSNALIATFWQTWPFAAGFGIASCVTGLVGLFLRWLVFKRETRKPKLRQISSVDEI